MGKSIHIDNVPIDLTSDAINHYFSNIACELNAQVNNTPATWKGPSSIHTDHAHLLWSISFFDQLWASMERYSAILLDLFWPNRPNRSKLCLMMLFANSLRPLDPPQPLLPPPQYIKLQSVWEALGHPKNPQFQIT